MNKRDEFEDILDEAEVQTEIEMEQKLSSIVNKTKAEINQYFPTPVDKDKLNQLMAIVNNASSSNQKVANLVNNIDSLAGTVINLVRLFTLKK